MTAPEAVRLRGVCRIIHAFDLGFAVDLDESERRAADEGRREILRHRRRAPRDFQYRPVPLRITKTAAPLRVGDATTDPRVDFVIFDFGAAAVTYTIPLSHTLGETARLSDTLYEEQSLAIEARAHAEELLALLGPAVTRPHLTELAEDYVAFHVREFAPSRASPESPEAFVRSEEEAIARVLRAEAGDLSPQEVADALSVQIAFGREDVTLIDWSTALIFDPEPADVWPILEFATVQLLELRVLDDVLDDALERSFHLLREESWGRRALFGRVSRDLRKIALWQAEAAGAFEAAQNALKLLSDQFLARLYRSAAARFHLGDWRRSIREKLDALDGIYAKLSDQRQATRLEVLEWIIIVLIAVSIAIQILNGGH